MHFRAALAAVEQSSQRVRLFITVAAPDRPAKLLRGFPCSLVNNGFVGILKDFPVLFGSLFAVLVPVAGLKGLEIDGMPHVLHAGENVAHRRTPPAVGIFKLVVPAVAHAFCGKVGRWTKHLFLGQNIRNLIHALAVNDHTED
ncbi:50S ribosomal protein L11, partial [Dysosmobacter welbionis]